MLSFIIAIIAGALTPLAEPWVIKVWNRFSVRDLPLAPGEMRTLSFVAMMLFTSIIFLLLGNAPAFLLVLGGGIGLFAKRFFEIIRKFEDAS